MRANFFFIIAILLLAGLAIANRALIYSNMDLIVSNRELILKINHNVEALIKNNI